MISETCRRLGAELRGNSFACCWCAPRPAAQSADLAELAKAANSPDEATRLKAIETLGQQGAAAVPALTALLKAESPLTRAYAARALGSVGPAAKSAAEGLIGLLGDEDPTVRRQAIGALAAIRPGPKVSVPLFAKLMQDADPGVRMRVMQIVAEAKGNAVPALVEALNNEAAAYWACIILRDIGPDAAAAGPALVAKLKDPRPEIRREAALALGTIGDKDSVDAIAPLLKDEHARVAATYALAMLGSIPPEAESVVRANVKSDDAMLAAISMWALARVHPDDMKLKKAVLEHLVKMLQDKDPFVRTAAARGLASLPPSPEIALPIFKEALANADATTAQYLLDALAGLGAPAVPNLIQALGYAPLRPEVASILGRIGPPAAPAAPALAKLLSDPDPNVTSEAAHALAAIGPAAKAAVPALIESLKTAEGKPLYAVVFALGSIGPDAKAADLPLLDIIKKHDDSLSVLSAWALLQIHGATERSAGILMPELVAGLSFPQAESRLAAAESLGQLGAFAKSAAPALEKAKQDSDPRVREAATKALVAIQG